MKVLPIFAKGSKLLGMQMDMDLEDKSKSTGDLS